MLSPGLASVGVVSSREFHYERRRPERTTLYEVLRDNLDTLYAASEEGFASALPSFVKRELEAYLECGLWRRCPCEARGCEREGAGVPSPRQPNPVLPEVRLPGRCRFWRRCRGSMSSRFRATPGLGRAPATRACGRPTSWMQRCGPPRYADLALVKRFDADERAVSRCVSSSRT